MGHVGHAGNKRRERAHHRHEAGQNDGLAAMLFEKVVGAVQGVLVDPAVIVGEHALADHFANPVVEGVAGDGGGDQQRHQQPVIHFTGCTKRTGNEKKGIARKKEQDHQAGFTKYDGKQHRVDIDTILGKQHAEGFIDMQNHVEKLHQIHNFPKNVAANNTISGPVH